MTRRGLTVPAGLLAAGLATETANAAVPPALAHVVIQAAVASVLHGAAGSAAISASAVQMTRGVLRTMFYTKLIMAAAVIVMVAALATGAGVVLQNISEPGPEAIVAARGPTPAALPPKDLKKYPALRDSAVVPKDLSWSEVPPAEWVRVLDMLAARSKANFEKIKTWKGSYRLLNRYLLDKKFLASFPMAPKQVEPLIQRSRLHGQFRTGHLLGEHLPRQGYKGQQVLKAGHKRARRTAPALGSLHSIDRHG